MGCNDSIQVSWQRGYKERTIWSPVVDCLVGEVLDMLKVSPWDDGAEEDVACPPSRRFRYKGLANCGMDAIGA
jgi:hypothetical protein